MKKMCLVGVVLCLWAGGLSASAALPDDLGKAPQYLMLQGSRSTGRGPVQNALYLDTASIHVVDVEDSGMVLQADVIERTGKNKTLTHGVRYRLAEDGTESILGLDGKWYALPGNSDDPSAVGAMLVRSELGKPERREQFVTEIQQILLKKQAAPKEKDAHPVEPVAEAAPAPSGDTAAAEAPEATETAAIKEESIEAVQDAYAKSSAVKQEAQADLAAETKETAPAKPADAGKTQPAGKETPAAPAKDTPPSVEKDKAEDQAKSQPAKPSEEKAENPPVVVQIESHEPQIHIEITPAKEA